MSSETRNPNEGDFVLLTNEEHTELMKIVKDVSLCLDEDYQHQGTHYIRMREGVSYLEPKGSFIELVARARAVMEKNDG